MTEWPEPMPFEEGRHVPPFPIDALPKPLRDFARAAADQFLAPVDLPAVLALGCASAAVAGRVRIAAGPRWLEPANLYLLAVLPPSQHKSPVMKLATDPIEGEEHDLVERWRNEEAARQTKREVVKHRIATIKRRKASADTEQNLRDALAELAELASPPRPALLSDDATSEALTRRLEHGPLFMCSAEGRPFELMSGLYRSKGEDGADVYLKAWSEDPIRAARVTSGDVYVPHPNLTLCLAVQPAVVDKLARREDFRGRGLIARFLASYPKTNVGHRDWAVARPISDVVTQTYNHSIRVLLSIERVESLPVVAMSADAATIFAAYRQELEHAQRRDALLSEWQDLGGKLAGHAARLALVLHMVEHGLRGPQQELTAATMTAATTLTRYFVAHTIATWDGCSTEPKGARVVRWLTSTKRAVVTTREIHRAHQRLYQRAADARTEAVELAERGYLRPSGEPDHWEVNPRVYEATTKRGDSGDNAARKEQNQRSARTFTVTEEHVTAHDGGDEPMSRLSSVVAAGTMTASEATGPAITARSHALSSLSPAIEDRLNKGAT